MIQEKKDEKDVSLKRLQTGVDKIDEARWASHMQNMKMNKMHNLPVVFLLLSKKQQFDWWKNHLRQGSFAPWNKIRESWDSMLCSTFALWEANSFVNNLQEELTKLAPVIAEKIKEAVS